EDGHSKSEVRSLKADFRLQTSDFRLQTLELLARNRRRCFFLRLRGCGLLAALGRLRAVLLREPLDAALSVEQLLLAREERVAARADFEVQLVLGRPRLPRRPARAVGHDVVILGMNAVLHSVLLGPSGKSPLYQGPSPHPARPTHPASRSPRPQA